MTELIEIFRCLEIFNPIKLGQMTQEDATARIDHLSKSGFFYDPDRPNIDAAAEMKKSLARLQLAATSIRTMADLCRLLPGAQAHVLTRRGKSKSELRGDTNLKRGVQALCMMEWWRKFHDANDYPVWCRMVVRAALLQPSSASAERVFSLLKAFFPARRSNTLRDQVEASLMTAFNKRQPRLVSCAAYVKEPTSWGEWSKQ